MAAPTTFNVFALPKIYLTFIVAAKNSNKDKKRTNIQISSNFLSTQCQSGAAPAATIANRHRISFQYFQQNLNLTDKYLSHWNTLSIH